MSSVTAFESASSLQTPSFDKNKDLHTIALLVRNAPGVLVRVATVFSRRGYNIESPGDTCGFDQGTDLVNITEGQLDLEPLADNDGSTMTHALSIDSVALDRIPEVDCEVETDQRGQPRPETDGTMCDVGSFERQPEDL